MVKRNKFIAQPAIKLAVSAIVIVAVVVGDMLLKNFIVEHVKGTECIVLIPGVLRLIYATNDGAAWSMLSGKQEFFIILTVAVLMVVLYILVRGYVKGWVGVVSLAACIGGTIGNFIDRVRQGYVVDMFETLFVEYPIFNVADICLTLGCIVLGVYILFLHDGSAAEERMPKKGGFSIVAKGGETCVSLRRAEDGKVSSSRSENHNADA
ncbi:MAG: signal peptidase II [Clostridia bacterium]|nr:signal peptidase II [Clostridia bacterium]